MHHSLPHFWGRILWGSAALGGQLATPHAPLRFVLGAVGGLCVLPAGLPALFLADPLQQLASMRIVHPLAAGQGLGWRAVAGCGTMSR